MISLNTIVIVVGLIAVAIVAYFVLGVGNPAAPQLGSGSSSGGSTDYNYTTNITPPSPGTSTSAPTPTPYTGNTYLPGMSSGYGTPSHAIQPDYIASNPIYNGISGARRRRPM